mmetsp:Transcript_25651/g.42378  ORF Transcript_25651/g.42378 Transcript_25651/m.42378 type:complete len:200 (+) Transcript_25651:257-856(+)
MTRKRVAKTNLRSRISQQSRQHLRLQMMMMTQTSQRRRRRRSLRRSWKRLNRWLLREEPTTMTAILISQPRRKRRRRVRSRKRGPKRRRKSSLRLRPACHATRTTTTTTTTRRKTARVRECVWYSSYRDCRRVPHSTHSCTMLSSSFSPERLRLVQTRFRLSTQRVTRAVRRHTVAASDRGGVRTLTMQRVKKKVMRKV